jgi:predicted DNA-binding transcriptional regulator AlpA
MRTLQNRKPADLPPYTKVGGKRLFFKQDILAWMQKRKNRR